MKKEFNPIKHISGTYEEGNGIILSNGNKAKLVKFEKYTGIPTIEKMTYIECVFAIYCERNDLIIIN